MYEPHLRTVNEPANAIPERRRDDCQPLARLPDDGQPHGGAEDSAGPYACQHPLRAGGCVEQEHPSVRNGDIGADRVERRWRARSCRRGRLDGGGCQHRGRYSESSNRIAAGKHRAAVPLSPHVVAAFDRESEPLACAPSCSRAATRPSRPSWPSSCAWPALSWLPWAWTASWRARACPRRRSARALLPPRRLLRLRPPGLQRARAVPRSRRVRQPRPAPASRPASGDSARGDGQTRHRSWRRPRPFA